MSKLKDFVIENEEIEILNIKECKIIEYIGNDSDVVIPEGVTYVTLNAFEDKNVTSITIPASLEESTFLSNMKYLQKITVSEGNKRLKSIDGLLYDINLIQLKQVPAARIGEISIPEGVTEMYLGAMIYSQIDSLILPTTFKMEPHILPSSLKNIMVSEGNPYFKSIDGVLYDITGETLLHYPTGKDGDVYISDNVKKVLLDSFACDRAHDFHIHIGANVDVQLLQMEVSSNNDHITIYAPSGSSAERIARRSDCKFVAEGEPVSMDDSGERKDRAFQDWRQIFAFSTRSKGINISKYVRGSKIVYLPDKMGKASVASIDKSAFPGDVTVFCSKTLFTKLSPETKATTIHSFLVNQDMFNEDEQEYLLAYLKTHRTEFLERYINEEDYPALDACFDVMAKVKTLMEECLAITEQRGKQQVNAFLMEKFRNKEN